ncbi:putative quinol monooxygenase [Psychromarinibacter sp. C21-152]|uniref:Quinol monooxygenase n=1 Tax=Psychromarinibacter sediminicola TaxID=3033385 RepID=A0AAE3T785_9RHOB|nr:putative quinol monooxygenase [Psychromarinibacter sediminicola]MDF0600065.1 putative quinol monooxygenase [Psychromarinibacter sediminicola]
MLVVTGVTRIAETDAPAARAAAAKVAALTRTEDGCFTYAFYEDVEVPGRFRVYEEWRDEAALRAHLATAHIAEFREVIGGLEVLERDIKMLKGCTEEPL